MITENTTEVDPLKRIFELMRKCVPDYNERFELNQVITAYGLQQYRNGIAEGVDIKKRVNIQYKKAS